MKVSSFGAVMGIVGAIIGGFIVRALGFADQGGLINTIFVAVIGAVLLTLLIRLVTKGRTRNFSLGCSPMKTDLLPGDSLLHALRSEPAFVRSRR